MGLGSKALEILRGIGNKDEECEDFVSSSCPYPEAVKAAGLVAFQKAYNQVIIAYFGDRTEEFPFELFCWTLGQETFEVWEHLVGRQPDVLLSSADKRGGKACQ